MAGAESICDHSVEVTYWQHDLTCVRCGVSVSQLLREFDAERVDCSKKEEPVIGVESYARQETRPVC